MGASTSYRFLSNVRTSLSGNAGAPQDGGSRRSFGLTLTPTAPDAGQTGSASSLSSEIRGAGDIVGIDNKVISHVEPSPGSVGVEPNYCPYVEFVDADFPWRYTLDVEKDARVKPWLCLIALAADEYESLGSASTLLERILITDASQSLPNLNQSWAWAHTQFRGVDTNQIDSALKDDTEKCLSRLLCMRALSDLTRYTLCLVPVFEQGRLAGLGRSDTASSWDQLAWDSSDSASVELPVYAKWTFSTSKQEDFESLVNRLSPVDGDELGDIGGTRSVYIGNPGAPLGITSSNLTMEGEGALMSPEFERQSSIAGGEAFADALKEEVNTVLAYDIRSESEDGPDKDDPVVSIPAYGKWHTAYDTIDETSESSWFGTVNLDMRYRTAAGSGARIVQRYQEYFMQKCWEQAEEVVAQMQQRTMLQLADSVTQKVVGKTLATMTDSAVIALTEPLHSLTAVSVSQRQTIEDILNQAAVPKGYTTRVTRRMFAKRGGNTTSADKVAMPVLPGSKADRAENRRRKRQILSRDKRLDVTTKRGTMVLTRYPENMKDDARLSIRRIAAKAMPSSPALDVGKYNEAKIAKLTTDRLLSLPSLKAAYTFETSVESALETPVIGPVLGDGIAHYLYEESPSLLIPDSGNIPDNSVLLLKENRYFLEAVLAGANHEMLKELLWREYPVDLGATVFKRFWDKGQDASDDNYDDVKPLLGWNRLGNNPLASSQTKERMVLVIRGDVIRRYPNLIVALDKQTESNAWDAANSNLLEPVFSGTLDKYTAYFGFDVSEEEIKAAMDQYYFLLFEPTGRFRFGLDISEEANSEQTSLPHFPVLSLDLAKRKVGLSIASSRKITISQNDTPAITDDLTWGHVSLQNSDYINVNRAPSVGESSPQPWGSDRDADASNLAKALFQKPVCAIISASKVIDA